MIAKRGIEIAPKIHSWSVGAGGKMPTAMHTQFWQRTGGLEKKIFFDGVMLAGSNHGKMLINAREVAWCASRLVEIRVRHNERTASER